MTDVLTDRDCDCALTYHNPCYASDVALDVIVIEVILSSNFYSSMSSMSFNMSRLEKELFSESAPLNGIDLVSWLVKQS